jgi:hypothetical protein
VKRLALLVDEAFYLMFKCKNVLIRLECRLYSPEEGSSKLLRNVGEYGQHIETSEKSLIFNTPLSGSQTPHNPVLSDATPLYLLARWIHGKEVIPQRNVPVNLSPGKDSLQTQRYVFYEIGISQ